MNPLDLNKELEIVNDELSVINASAIETTNANQTTITTLLRVDYNLLNKSELIESLKNLIDKDVEIVKDEVETIKQVFYKKIKAEHDEQMKLVELESHTLAPLKDELEETFKSILNDFRIKKAAHTAQIEKDKDNNLLLKQNILEQMKKLVDSNEEVSLHVNEFRELQRKWKSIGQVPQSSATDLWKKYNIYQESFWDLIKINNELREYDFKKNLEAKTFICEASERLINESDIISAFHQLQKFHEEWHEIGPVTRDLREQIWNRFKEVSTIINKKHQEHFDTIRKLEDDNMNLKVQLCEKVEAFDYSGFKTYKAWDDATVIVLSWQDEWRSIGFAPRKINQKIFDRYRKACDGFFMAKAEFYKESKGVLNQNLEKKKDLCDKAETLKDSIEWKETADKLIQMQKEWKTIGPVSKKFSDDLWKRFIAACDYFFEQKNKNSTGQRSIESENLIKKKALVEKIEALNSQTNAAESLATLRVIMAEWNLVGHVPFKEKDKIYKEYRTAVDIRFEKLNVDSTQRRIDSFKNNLKDISAKGENKLVREREKLVRAYEHLKAEIATYENNIGFFSASSKKGSGLIKEMERKIESLKEESRLIEEKINLIEQNL